MTSNANDLTERLRRRLESELAARCEQRAAYHRSRYGGGDRADARPPAQRLDPAPGGRPEPLARHLWRELGDDALAVDAHPGPGSRRPPGHVLRRAGVASTVHGFRSSARSWMAESAVPAEVAEACLAHVPRSKVVQAYQRSDLLERRAEVLQAWSEYVG